MNVRMYGTVKKRTNLYVLRSTGNAYDVISHRRLSGPRAPNILDKSTSMTISIYKVCIVIDSLNTSFKNLSPAINSLSIRSKLNKVISVVENLIEEIILQDKCHKTKYVDNNPKTSTSQIEQEQKPNLNQQNTEKTDLYAQRGSCFMDMSSTTSCPPDVSIQQSTKQNLLVEGPLGMVSLLPLKIRSMKILLEKLHKTNIPDPNLSTAISLIVKSNNFIFRGSNTIAYINHVTVTVSKTKSKSLNISKSSRKRVRQKGESR